MWDIEMKIENITDQELIECINIFDQELQARINKEREFDEMVLGKYRRTANGIQLNIHQQENAYSLSFGESFFEDFCYSTRQERNKILDKVMGQIQAQLVSKK